MSGELAELANYTLVIPSLERWLFVGWMAIVGGCVGSFLNVVAYRAPRGMSLLHPPSQCPQCGKAIRWRDNLPVLGWLLLAGRCRDCRAPISPRYPIVEALAAGLAGFVTFLDLVPSGVPIVVGELNFVMQPLVLAVHLLVTFGLFCAALIEFDDQRPPLAMTLSLVVAALVLTTLWPQLRMETLADDARWPAALASGRALGAALLLALLAWPALVARPDRGGVLTGLSRAENLALIGVCLGVSAVTAVAVLTVVGRWVTSLAERFGPAAARIGWAAWLLLGTLVWIANARWSFLGPTASNLASWPQLGLAAGIVAVGAILIRLTGRPADQKAHG